MRLMILGAGTVGRQIGVAARHLAPFTDIIFADREGARAEAVAQPLGLKSIALDAGDRDALVAAMSEVDAVVSAIGPSTRFGVPTLRAAIEARRLYADICDDPHPTQDMLALHDEAREAGVRALVGLGASPGISNMLAVEAGSRLDHVDSLYTGWGSAGRDDDEDGTLTGDVTAALEHWVEQASGTIPILRDGIITEVAPLANVEIDYPGIGKVVTRSIGHPEPVTLGRRFPTLRDSINVMDFSSYIFSCLERAGKAVDRGGTPREGAELLLKFLRAEEDDSLLSRKALSYAWHSAQDKLTGKRHLPPLWALAEGQRNGKRKKVAVSLAGTVPGGMGPVTGVPAAIVAAMLASGQTIGGPGVQTVDTALEPDIFFARLLPFLRLPDGSIPPAPFVVTEE
jgi:saccharopine dehydrogenase-like NADP-dependent oxidoreductase